MKKIDSVFQRGHEIGYEEALDLTVAHWPEDRKCQCVPWWPGPQPTGCHYWCFIQHAHENSNEKRLLAWDDVGELRTELDKVYRHSDILSHVLREIGKMLQLQENISIPRITTLYETALRELDRSLKTKRYCFVTKNIQTFVLCGNCDSFFCIDESHCEWETEMGDYGSVLAHYPVHRKCL